MKEHSIDIQLSHPDDLFHLFGSNERHLRLMEQELDVVIHARTEIVQVIGQEEDCEKARQVIEALLILVNRGMTIGTPDVVTAIQMVRNDELESLLPCMKKKSSRIATASPFGSKHWVKRIGNQSTVVQLDTASKRWVDRRVNQNCLAFFCKGLNSC